MSQSSLIYVRKRDPAAQTLPLKILTGIRVTGPFDETLLICRSNMYYRKTSSISRIKSQNLNVSRLLLQWTLPNPSKPGVKLRMKM